MTHRYDCHDFSRKKTRWGRRSCSERLLANLLSWILVVRGTIRITYHFKVILTIAVPTPRRTMTDIAATVAYLLLRLGQYHQGIIRDEGIRATALIGFVSYTKQEPFPSSYHDHDAQQRWMRQGGGRPTAGLLRPTVPRAP